MRFFILASAIVGALFVVVALGTKNWFEASIEEGGFYLKLHIGLFKTLGDSNVPGADPGDSDCEFVAVIITIAVLCCVFCVCVLIAFCLLPFA